MRIATNLLCLGLALRVVGKSYDRTSLASEANLNIFNQRQNIGIPGCKLRKDPPKRFRCGKAGTLRIPYSHPHVIAYQPQIYDTLDQCLESLVSVGKYLNQSTVKGGLDAGGAFYNSTSGLCYIAERFNTHNPRTQPKFYPDPAATDGALFDTRCFDCPHPCDDKRFGVNLLENGGFEQSPDGFDYIGPWEFEYHFMNVPALYNLVAPGSESDTALYFEDGPNLLQYARTCKRNHYRLAFDYKLPATPEGDEQPGLNAQLNVGFPFLYGQYFERTNYDTADTAWNRIEVYPHHNADDFYFYVQSPGALLDNMELVRVPALADIPVQPGASNIVVNSGFENNGLQPWIAATGNDPTDPSRGTSTTSLASPGISSSKALAWTRSASRPSGDTYDTYYSYWGLDLNQTLATSEGRRYKISFEAMDTIITPSSEDTRPTTIYVWFNYVWEDFSLPADGEAHEFTTAIRYAGTNSTVLYLSVQADGRYESPLGETIKVGTTKFDNFQVIELDL